VVRPRGFQDLGLELKPVFLVTYPQPFGCEPLSSAHSGTDPSTVTNSRCPRTFTRSTANPLSSLKKVNRSTRPAISSNGARGCGEESVMLIEVYAV
jgi:hypothetical protein